MKKNNSTKRGPQDGNHQSALPEKVGWVRKFCGKGIFREIWKNRYVVLKGDQLYISEKEQVGLYHHPVSAGKGHPLVRRLELELEVECAS
ncbi:pleckstrin homology domain containing O1 [Phyllostomus discolor]|uniref:Pleckstrin homology domain containing O1 n=1 Tax=Phyllostomus discolor TaxID=89673 RepID=A0A834DCV7_9CHIR|nr:pleckstrin homology domain containing O1 [Phyllostomus discolor]